MTSEFIAASLGTMSTSEVTITSLYVVLNVFIADTRLSLSYRADLTGHA